jgi:hypothetical protein
VLGTLKHPSEIVIRKINQKKQQNVERFFTISMTIIRHVNCVWLYRYSHGFGDTTEARKGLEIFGRQGSVLRDDLGANALGHRPSVISENIR